MSAERSVNYTRCLTPTGETTTLAGWFADTYAQWSQTLLPGSTSFAGRTVTEKNAPGGVDSCKADFPDSPYRPWITHSGSSWAVETGNHWGPDTVGWPADQVQYYQAERVARGLPMPCGAEIPQVMAISCPGGVDQEYTQTVLKSIIYPNSLLSGRGGNESWTPYPWW